MALCTIKLQNQAKVNVNHFRGQAIYDILIKYYQDIFFLWNVHKESKQNQFVLCFDFNYKGQLRMQ